MIAVEEMINAFLTLMPIFTGVSTLLRNAKESKRNYLPNSFKRKSP